MTLGLAPTSDPILTEFTTYLSEKQLGRDHFRVGTMEVHIEVHIKNMDQALSENL